MMEFKPGTTQTWHMPTAAANEAFRKLYGHTDIAFKIGSKPGKSPLDENTIVQMEIKNDPDTAKLTVGAKVGSEGISAATEGYIAAVIDDIRRQYEDVVAV